MSWLWQAAEQAASGDLAGAWDTASQGAQDTAEQVVDQMSSTVDDVANAMGLGSTGGGGNGTSADQGLIGRVYTALDDISGGNLSEASQHLGAAVEAAMAGDVVGAVGSTGSAIRSGSDGVTAAADEAGHLLDEGVDALGSAVGRVGDALGSRAAEGVEAVGAVGGAVVDRLDAITDGKVRETAGHLGAAVEAAGEGDLDGAVERGVAAAGSAAEGGVNVVVDAAGAVRRTAGAVAGKARDTVDELDEATGGHLGSTTEAINDGIDWLTGGKLGEGVQHLGAAVRAVASGDVERAAEEGAAAAGALEYAAYNVVERVFDKADEISDGRLGEARQGVRDAIERVGAGDLEGAADAAVGAGASLAEAGVTLADVGVALAGIGVDHAAGIPESLAHDIGGALASADEATGGHVRSTLSALDEAATEIVEGTFAAVDEAAGGRLAAARDHLTDAAGRSVDGDFEGALDAVVAGHDTLLEATAELAATGLELVSAFDVDPPAEAAEEVSELLARAGEQAAAAVESAADDAEGAAAAAEDAATAYTEVTARVGLATAVTLDDATDGAMSRATASIEKARAELADGRYDAALVDLQRAGGEYRSALRAVGGERDPDDLVAGFTTVDRGDDLSAEGHERLGQVVDSVVRRLPPTNRTDPDPSDQTRGIDDPVIDALAGGHLAAAADAIRRAAAPGDDPDRVTAALQDADDHLREAGPATATAVVAIVDEAEGGHLGATVGLAGRTAHALRAGDYDTAAALAPQVSDRHARSLADLATGPGAGPGAHGPDDDLTEGHADAAIQHLEDAIAREAEGDREEALEQAQLAADEYDAAILSYDRNVDRAVDELVGTDAPEPVRARAGGALDARSDGALTEARSSLERGATEARAGDLEAAVSRGHHARSALETARSAYAEPDTPLRLASDLRVSLEADLDPSDFGRGAVRESEPEPSGALEVEQGVELPGVVDPEPPSPHAPEDPSVLLTPVSDLATVPLLDPPDTTPSDPDPDPLEP